MINFRCLRSSTLVLLLSAASAGLVLAQPTGTVIVANMSDNTVTLLDAATGAEHATLPSGPAPHEVSVSSSGEWAIVTNYGDRNSVGSSLTVINVSQARIEREIDLGPFERPHGVFVLPGDSLVAITSEAMQSLVFVNFQQGEIVDTMSTTQRASHMLASTPDGRSMFTTNIVDGTITHFDGIGRERKGVYPVAEFVEGIAVSPDGARVWVGSNRERTVHVFNTTSLAMEVTYEDFGFPYRMAVTPDGRLALLCDPGKSEIRVIDSQTLELIKIISISGEGSLPSAEFPDSAAPEGLVITPDSRYAFVSLQALNQVALVDLGAMEITAQYETGGWPDGISYSIMGVQ